MNSDQLIKFKTIVECESMTQAAETLFITQSALSHTITSLENELNTSLFIRDRKKLILTQDGKKLLFYANAISDTLNQAWNAIKEQNVITIAANNVCAAFLLAEFPPEDLKRVFIREDNEASMPELLRSGEIDIATCSEFYMRDYYYDKKIPAYIMQRNIVCREQLGLLVSKNSPWYERNYVTLEEVIGTPLCARMESKTLKTWLESLENITSRKFEIDFWLDRYSYDLIGNKVDYPEIIIVNSIYNPDLNRAVERDGKKLIPVNDRLASRFVYMWYLLNNKDKVEPILQSLKNFYTRNVRGNEQYRRSK